RRRRNRLPLRSPPRRGLREKPPDRHRRTDLRLRTPPPTHHPHRLAHPQKPRRRHRMDPPTPHRPPRPPPQHLPPTRTTPPPPPRNTPPPRQRRRRPRRGLASRSATRGQHQLTHPGGVGLALGGLHHRADDRAGGLHLAAPDLVDHVGVGGQRLVDGRLDHR